MAIGSKSIAPCFCRGQRRKPSSCSQLRSRACGSTRSPRLSRSPPPGLTVGADAGDAHDGAEAGEGAGGAAAARARPRRAHRSGGGRAAEGRRSLRRRQGARGGAGLRAVPLDGGGGRLGARLVAVGVRPARRAGGARPGQLARPAALRARPLLAWRHAGREGGLAPGAPGAARHLVRPARGGSPLPAVPARPADVRPELLPAARAREAVAAEAARLPPRPRDRRAAICCSASPTSGSAGSSRRSESSSARSGPEAEVARAVGRFDKADPSRTFSRLGPLAKRYPRSQSVRFHLGLCLLWLGSLNEAKKQLRLARDLGPGTPLGTEAQAVSRAAAVNAGPRRHEDRPNGLWRSSGASGTLPPSIGGAFDGTPSDG